MRGTTNRMFLLRLALPVGFLCLALAATGAQDPPSIAGKVTDAKGIAIPAATVRVALEKDGQPVETLTEWDGSFRFSGLPPGVYSLAVEMPGFQKSSRDGIGADTEAGRNLAISLPSIPRNARPGAARPAPDQQKQAAAGFQPVEVTDLPGMQLFQQSTAQSGAELSSTLPRQDNSEMLLITGNTASIDAGSWEDPAFRQRMMDAGRQMGFEVGMFQDFGGRGGEAGFQAGGEGGMAAAGGRGGGGRGGGGPGFVMAGGRGGRGAAFRQPVIQGSITENYSNSALNARSYSLTGQELPKPVQIGNNYSLTLGGVIPFIKPATNTQQGGRGGGMCGGRGGGRGGGQPGWTFTYSGSRNRSAQDILTTVPSDLERSGDFSQTYVQVQTMDPATGELIMVTRPVQLYRVPTDPGSLFTTINNIDPIAAGLLEYIPGANLPCAADLPCVNNYAFQRSLPSTSDQIQANVSGLRLTSRDNLAVNYSMRRGSSLSAQMFPGLDSTRTNFAQNAGLSGMHSFRPRLIANWRVTWNRTRTESMNGFAYVNDVAGELGITGVSREPINYGVPTVNYTNYGDLSLAATSLNRNQTFSVSSGVNMIGNRHSIQIGGDVSWNQRNILSDPNARGTFVFNGYATGGVDAEGRQLAGSGNDFADFLLGLPYSTSRRYVDPAQNPYGSSNYLRNRTYSLYIQDNWRARSNLTLNVGLRYEYTGPSYEKYDRLTSLDVAPGFSEVVQVFPNETGSLSGQYFPRSLVNADRNNFAPRIGIAWKPTSRSPFVFRAGYGISFNVSAYSSIIGNLVGQPPFALTQNLPTDPSDPLTLQNGFPVLPSEVILNTYAIDPNYRPAYVQQWNLAVQTQVSQLFMLDVSYNGTRGTGLDIVRAPNGAESAGTASKFQYQSNGANSIYHGMSVSLVRRFSRGFNVQNSYTLAKSIDNASGIGGGFAVAQNDADLAAERSLSSGDQRHNFNTSFSYELPMGQNRRFFAAASTGVLNFVAGWTINGNFQIGSGTPMSARYTSTTSGGGSALYNSLRPDATGVPVSLPWGDRTVLQYFNTTAFAIPQGQYGNAGRNTIAGPGSHSMNLSLRKSFRLGENNRRIDFGWQVTNVFNHPNWSGVSTNVTALNFGQVTGVGRMRAMTFNLRINF